MNDERTEGGRGGTRFLSQYTAREFVRPRFPLSHYNDSDLILFVTYTYPYDSLLLLLVYSNRALLLLLNSLV